MSKIFLEDYMLFIITEACNRLKDILGILDIECLNLTSEKIESFGSMGIYCLPIKPGTF